MESLITTFTLVSVVFGAKCLKILKIRENMCFIFSKIQRDKYESILPEDEKEEYKLNN